MKKNIVKYGNDTYEQAGLNLSDLLLFGTIIQSKIAALGLSVGVVFSDKADMENEIFSFYQTVTSALNPEEARTILKLFLENENNLLIVNGIALTTDEAEKHFAGDLFRAFKVAWGLAVQNLGEQKVFMENLPQSIKTLINFFQKSLQKKKQDIERDLKQKGK